MTNDTYFSSLSESEEAHLQQILFDLSESYHGMDFVELHGFLTGMVVSNDTLDIEGLLGIITQADNNLSAHLKKDLLDLIPRATRDIQRRLYNDEIISLPFELDDDFSDQSSPLVGWSLGFIDAVHLNEVLWFEDENNLDACQAIIPLALIAGEELDLPTNDPRRDPNTIKKFLEELPQLVTELYFLIREGPEIPTGKKQKKSKSKKSKSTKKRSKK